MITKTGTTLAALADFANKATTGVTVASIPVGYLEAKKLTKAEKAKLRKAYGLSDDANLEMRSAGRGYVGALGGGIAGGITGNMLAGPHGAAIGRLLGAGAGVYTSAKKYSKANPILEKK